MKEEVIAAQKQAYADADRVNLPMLRKRLREIRYSEEQLAAFRVLAGKPVIENWIAQNQERFDARGLVQTMFAAVGQRYE